MFKRKTLVAALIAAAFGVPTTTMAQTPPAAPAAPASDHTFTANVAIASQYIFRGLTQTNEKPAIQGGFDYSHASGIYVGTWLSNISWFTDQFNGTPNGRPLSASLEWDIYGGYKGSFGGDWSYDLGYLHYEYPGDYSGLSAVTAKKPNTNELYGQIGWKWATLKYSHSLGNTFGANDASGTFYLDGSINYPIPDTALTLIAHVGKQKYKGRADFLKPPASGALQTSFDNDVLSYTDWKLGGSYDLSGVASQLKGATFTAYFTGTDAKATAFDANNKVTANIYQNAFGRNIGRGQFTVMFGKTF